MEPVNEPKSGRNPNQSEYDSGATGDRGVRSNCSEDGGESIGVSESDWQGDDPALPNSNHPGSETHGKALRLQVESVRSQKALLRMLMQQLDEQEKQLEKVIAEYEESIQGSSPNV
jgi:hypothetical protein